MRMSPAIVLKSKFVIPGSKEYKDYIKYISRDEAKVKANIQINEQQEENPFSFFYSYMDYMGDEEKQGMLFTSHQDSLNEEQKSNLQQQFQTAQMNGSPLWQDVISFNNAWLVKQGLLDEITGELNEEQFRNAIRAGVREMLQAEKWMTRQFGQRLSILIRIIFMFILPRLNQFQRVKCNVY